MIVTTIGNSFRAIIGFDNIGFRTIVGFDTVDFRQIVVVITQAGD